MGNRKDEGCTAPSFLGWRFTVDKIACHASASGPSPDSLWAYKKLLWLKVSRMGVGKRRDQAKASKTSKAGKDKKSQTAEAADEDLEVDIDGTGMLPRHFPSGPS